MCRFCGWRPRTPTKAKPLRIYDIALDDWRDATQLDIDLLGAQAQAYGVLRATVEQQHVALVERIRDMRSKAGQPA